MANTDFLELYEISHLLFRASLCDNTDYRGHAAVAQGLPLVLAFADRSGWYRIENDEAVHGFPNTAYTELKATLAGKPREATERDHAYNAVLL